MRRRIQTLNERIVSEVAAFWRAWSYRVKALLKKPKPEKLNRENESLTVFIHGYLADSTCWRPWMEHLSHQGHNVAAVDFGLDHPLQTIDQLADRLDRFLRHCTAQYQNPLPKIHLVGHSMGGIIAANYALRGSNSLPITSVISLAAPLKGAKLARAAKWIFSKCGEDMAPNSSLLKELSHLLENAPCETKFYYAAAKHDDLVRQADVTLGGATPQIFPCNHMGIIYDPQARDWLEEILQGQHA